MSEELKKKFTAFPTSFYNMEWVAQAATEGYEDFLKIFNESLPADMAIKPDNERFAMIYYGAFEHALNIMLKQVLNDTQTQIELDIRELENITAIMKQLADEKQRRS